MISQSVLDNAATIQKEFQNAKPFKHICIDNFLVDSYAEQALTDFPAFDKRKAINEYGEVGRKAVHSKLGEISPFYRTLYEWLFCEDFLAAMSAITGIPDLIGDPTLYGGGTHENLHGQALDPHVDFNYVAGGQAHRRVNLLIYLNKGWRSEWGGDIELHSNPRELDANEIRSFNVGFNRAVLFETNEYSWHGFPLIDLPEPEQAYRSRKCLSVYLYTRTRPRHEIAGTHGTFYVQRPLPAHISTGYTLTEADEDHIKVALRSRDKSIEAYQKLEERLGREIDGLQRYVADLVANIKLPLLGYALQVRRIDGLIWQDGWVSDSCSFELRAVADLRTMKLRGYLPRPDRFADFSVNVDINSDSATRTKIDESNFSMEMPVEIRSGESFVFRIRCNDSYNAKKLGEGDDDRDLAFILGSLQFF